MSLKKLRLILLLLVVSISAFAQEGNNDEAISCNQDSAEKMQLIKKAEGDQYLIRHIYFVGNSSTRFRTFRKQMSDDFNEGFVFTKKSLVKSIEGINKLKTIKPISLRDIRVELEPDKARDWNVIDFFFCVQEINRFLTDEEKRNLVKLIEEAESNQYLVRHIEISGNANTSGRVFWKKLAFGEGDIFTRELLETSIRNVSTIKRIYPIKVENIDVRLDRESRTIDIVIYVVERK